MRYKRMMKIFVATLLFVLSLSCSRGRKEEKDTPSHRHIPEETLVRTNRYLVEKDEERIQRYTERHGWLMTRSGTGLWYQIYSHGTGPRVTEGKKVTITYTLRLLDGTLCYSSEEQGPKNFVAGHGSVESGLEQGILMMRKGDKARLILPPFLAYGVPGDRNKIPPRSVIVYELEVTEVK